MRAVRGLHDPGDRVAADEEGLRGPGLGELRGLDDLLAGDVRGVRGLAEEVVEVRVRSQVLGVAEAVGAVEVDQGRVHAQGGDGDELLAVGVGRGDRPQLGVDAHDVGAEGGADGEEGQPVGGCVQAPHEHGLVELGEGEGGPFAGGPEVRLQRDRVEGREGGHELADLPGGGEQPDVGAAVRDHGEIGDLGAEQCAHQGHGLAPRAPAADPDGHPAAEPPDHLVGAHGLVGHADSAFASVFGSVFASVFVFVSVAVLPKVSRTRSATPLRLASKVKPCSKR